MFRPNTCSIALEDCSVTGCSHDAKNRRQRRCLRFEFKRWRDMNDDGVAGSRVICGRRRGRNEHRRTAND